MSTLGAHRQTPRCEAPATRPACTPAMRSTSAASMQPACARPASSSAPSPQPPTAMPCAAPSSANRVASAAFSASGTDVSPSVAMRPAIFGYTSRKLMRQADVLPSRRAANVSNQCR